MYNAIFSSLTKCPRSDGMASRAGFSHRTILSRPMNQGRNQLGTPRRKKSFLVPKFVNYAQYIRPRGRGKKFCRPSSCGPVLNWDTAVLQITLWLWNLVIDSVKHCTDETKNTAPVIAAFLFYWRKPGGKTKFQTLQWTNELDKLEQRAAKSNATSTAAATRAEAATIAAPLERSAAMRSTKTRGVAGGGAPGNRHTQRSPADGEHTTREQRQTRKQATHTHARHNMDFVAALKPGHSSSLMILQCFFFERHIYIYIYHLAGKSSDLAEKFRLWL